MNGDPFLMLQEMLGHYGIGAKSIVTGDGDYGQMLDEPLAAFCTTEVLTEIFPTANWSRAVPSAPRSRRRMENCMWWQPTLGLSIRERRRQARELLKIIGEATPFVLMGDFYDWFWPGSIRRRMLAAYSSGSLGLQNIPILQSAIPAGSDLLSSTRHIAAKLGRTVEAGICPIICRSLATSSSIALGHR